MLVSGFCAQVSLQVEAAGALGIPGIQHLQTRGLGGFFFLFIFVERHHQIIRCAWDP